MRARSSARRGTTDCPSVRRQELQGEDRRTFPKRLGVVPPDGDNKAYFGNVPDGTELRRARLSVSGTIYNYILFKSEYDFAGAGEKAQDGKATKEVAIKDAYIGVSGIPVIGTVQIGHQKEPFVWKC